MEQTPIQDAPSQLVTDAKSIIPEQDAHGSYRDNASLGIDDCPPRALELLGLMRSGKRQIVAEEMLHVTGEEMLSWKTNKYFRSKCASLNTANWGARELTQAYIKANEFEIARTQVKRATDIDRRDSQRAGETLFAITGLITKHEISATSDVMLEFKRKIMTERGELTVTERLTVTDTDAQSSGSDSNA